jgi:hypothetical protein
MRFEAKYGLALIVAVTIGTGAGVARADGAFTLQTPIEQLIANSAANEVVERILPGLSTHRMYETFKTMSLEELQGMAPKLLTQQRLADVSEALAQLPAAKTEK